MKHAFINTQSNAISNCNLAWRPASLREHTTDTTVKRVLGANVHDTRRDGSKRSRREQTDAGGETKEYDYAYIKARRAQNGLYFQICQVL